ncbi:MAG: sulfatase-like hydrolase/transferase [Deltaproteobacteria bacterium]|nr:sulfatase-like hydrolase/transferase [Deltaproteobacteria bacterium]
MSNVRPEASPFVRRVVTAFKWQAIAAGWAVLFTWLGHGGWPGSRVLAFYLGLLAASALPIITASSVLLAALASASSASPSVSRRLLQPFGRLQAAPIDARATGILLVAIPAITWALRLPAMPIAEHLVPKTLNIRDLFVRTTANILAFCAAGALAYAASHTSFLRDRIGRGRQGKGTAPAWGLILFVQFLLFRWSAQRDLGGVFLGRVAWLDVGSLLLFIVTGTMTVARMPPLRGRRGLRLGVVAALPGLISAAALVFTLARIGTDNEERSTLCQTYLGACPILQAVRNHFDFDGDGASAILGGGDCDDTDPAINPYATEVVGNGIDDNCLGGDLAALPPTETSTSTAAPIDSLRLPNFVILTIDSWRVDSIVPALMPERVAATPPTPRMTEYAQTGAFFTRAYTFAPYTSDALRALMTGHYVLDFQDAQHDFGMPRTLAEQLHTRGYVSWAIRQGHEGTNSIHAGFDLVDEQLSVYHQHGAQGETSKETADKALSMYAQLKAGSKPFLLWAHFYDPHGDYRPRAEAPSYRTGNVGLDRYLQEVWVTDFHIGRVLDQLRADHFFEKNLVVITADHGELLGEDDQWGHGHSLAEEVLRVPLIVLGRSVPAGVFSTRVTLPDVYPTLLRYAGISAPSRAHDLAPVWRGLDTQDRDVFVTSFWYMVDYKRALIHGRMKFIEDVPNHVEWLYDLEKDPHEDDNLIRTDARNADDLRQRLGHLVDLATSDKAREANQYPLGTDPTRRPREILRPPSE